MKKIYLKQLLAAILLLCSTVVSAETYSGTCGENVNWSLDTETGVLNISGTGEMTNYGYVPPVPWWDHRGNITTVNINNGVTSIGNSAFHYCNSLTSITIPNSVTTIGDCAFESCDDLTSITIPNSVTSIGYGAFRNCDGLTSITIPNSVTSIGGDAFHECSALTSITIPNGVTSIGSRAFYCCTGLTSVTIGNSVTTIGDCAFESCYRLTSVTIPGSVTSIGDDAFSVCTGLKSITIPNSVTSIGIGAFYGCSSLTSIVVDEENSVYDSREGCNAIIESATITLIQGCMNTIIPNSVTSIGEGAFSGCDGVTEITIPNSVTSIGRGAFLGCYSLTSITIPHSVTSIGDDAFRGCGGLTSVTIPGSVTSIGDYAFSVCNGLTSVTIGNGVTSIGDCAFSVCDGLTSIVVDEGNSVYDSREGCNAIIETATNTLVVGCKNSTIPGTVTSIGDSAFRYCTGLTSITIPNSVTSIGEDAFWDCYDLTDIYIASNPTIGFLAISSSVTCHLTITDSDAADFNNHNNNTYADVSYTRTISEGKYGTIMLPFAPDEASLQNYAFYTLKEAGDGYIRFEEVAAPEANTPYLYTLRAGGENTAITGGQTTIAADINNCNVDGWELVGSFSNQTIDCTSGNYYAYSAARNEINRITKTLTVRPFRAYLTSTAEQNSNLRVFIGGTTGVTKISPDDFEGFNNGAVYDLYGRPVNEPAKGGVYIIDGKKVVL